MITARRRSRPGITTKQVPLAASLALIAEPAAQPIEVEVGLPVEGQLAHQRLARHAALLDGPPVVGQQVIAQGVQVAVVMHQQGLRNRIQRAVGIVLVRYLPCANRAIVFQ